MRIRIQKWIRILRIQGPKNRARIFYFIYMERITFLMLSLNFHSNNCENVTFKINFKKITFNLRILNFLQIFCHCCILDQYHFTSGCTSLTVTLILFWNYDQKMQHLFPACRPELRSSAFSDGSGFPVPEINFVRIVVMGCWKLTLGLLKL